MYLLKRLLLVLLSGVGLAVGFLLMGSGSNSWFSPFVGLMILISLPYAGAMVVLYRERS